MLKKHNIPLNLFLLFLLVDANVNGQITNGAKKVYHKHYKEVSNIAPKIGDAIIYTSTVRNDGSSDVTNINVTNTLPMGLIYLNDKSSFTNEKYTTSNIDGLSSMILRNTESISLQITTRIESVGTIINTTGIKDVDQNNSDSTKNNGNLI